LPFPGETGRETGFFGLDIAALWLAQHFGIGDRVEITPLFETASALEQGVHVIEDALRSPHWRAYLKRTGRLVVQFGVGGVLYSWYLITQLPHQHDATLAFLTLALAFVILTGYTSINAVVKAELFPTHVRALGVGLGYALANSLFGGTAPLIYHATASAGGVGFVVYLTVLLGVTLVAALAMRGGAATALDAPRV